VSRTCRPAIPSGGIDANPERCIAWLDDVLEIRDDTFTRGARHE
jgi:hypothetical protein